MEAIIAIVVITIILIIAKKGDEYRFKYNNNKVIEADNKDINFECTNCIEGIIELDEKRHLFKLIKSKYSSPSLIYKYSDIIDFELLQNDDVIETKSGIGKAIAGGVLFGGIGAIIGGTTATKTNQKFINSLKIKITVNAMQNPILLITLVKIKLSTNSSQYMQTLEIAQKILSILTIMKNNSAEIKENYDELINYKKLLDDGIITQDEYEYQKKKLLNLE